MLRSELLSIIQQNLGNRTDKNSLIYSAIDFGQKKIARSGHIFGSLTSEFSWTISAGDSVLPLPAYARHIMEMRFQDATLTNSYPMTLKTKLWVATRWSNIAVMPQGRPVYAYKEGNSLYLVPISNGSYTIKATLYYDPAPMDDTSQDVAVSGSDDCVIAYATAYVMQSLGMMNQAITWMQRYGDALGDLKREDKRNPGMDYTMDGIDDPLPTGGSPWLDPFVGGASQL